MSDNDRWIADFRKSVGLPAMSEPDPTRNDAIVSYARRFGQLRAASKFGLSRQRISQIVRKHESARAKEHRRRAAEVQLASRIPVSYPVALVLADILTNAGDQ